MRFTRHLWVFGFFLGMALAVSASGWFFFTRMMGSIPLNAQPISGWLLAGYLALMLFLAGIFTLGFVRLLGDSNQSFVQALQRLARSDLPRMSSALSKLSEGDLTVQVEQDVPWLNQAQFPDAQALAAVYNEIAQEIQLIYQKFNDVTDEPCQRLVYVGGDSFQEGRACGELMGEILQGQGKIATLTSMHTHAMEIRKAGFRSVLAEKFPGIQVAEVVDCHGQLDTVQPRVRELLKKVPDLAGIYITNGTAPQMVAKALVEAGKTGKVKLVCHDLVDGTMRAMQEGVVTTTISQDPFAQGHDPVIYLYNYLVTGAQPPRSRMITHMDRITVENYCQFWDPERGAIENEAALERRARPVDQLPQRPLRILVLGREDISFYEPVKRGVLMAAEELRERSTVVEWIEPEAARKSHTYGAADYGPVIEAAAGKYNAIAVPVYDKALVVYINRAVAAGVPVATYNSEPSSLRNLINNLISQSQHLRDICVDLAQSASISGERAKHINESIGQMTQALHQEARSAVQAIETTGQIAEAMTSINTGAEEQTSAVNSVSEAIDQISYVVSSTNAAALTSEETAEQAVQIARQGAKTIEETLKQIQEISSAVKASVEQIYELNKISRQINGIASTVSDFAEQTNLLALNAAIEAARAGESGAGFAVVAAEIRELAEMSKRSTKEITGLIHSVQHNASKMVRTVDEAMLQAQAGGVLAAQAGEALDALLKSAEKMRDQTAKVVTVNTNSVDALDQLISANRRVSEVVEENVAATRQVADSIQHTVGMVDQMTGISRENATSIEAIHASTDDVAERAQELRETILSLVDMAEELQGSAATFKIKEM